MDFRIVKQGHALQGWDLCLALPYLFVSLLHSTVNFDHFQILRAIGKGSFGKVRKSLWLGHWRVVTNETMDPHL